MSRPNELPRRWRARLASVEAAAIAGILCAAGWLLGLGILLASPVAGAGDAEIRRFYSGPDVGRDALVALQLIVFSTIAFMWFVGVVRSRLGEQEPRLVGTVFLGGAIILAGLMLVGAAVLAAPAALVEAGGTPDPGAAAISRTIAVTVLSVFIPRVATLVMFSTAALARRARALPGWLIVLTYVVGIAEFVNVTVSTPAVFVFPAWVALVSVTLLIRPRPGAAQAAGG